MALLHYKNVTLDKVLGTNDQPRKTKIVCTIGPSCDSVEQLVSLIDAGLNICRINCSHGDKASIREKVTNINLAKSQRPESQVAILLDTKGPEIRTGFLENPSGVQLTRGSHLEIVTDYEFKGNDKVIACSYPKLAESVKIGDTVLCADGSLSMKVVEIRLDSKSIIVEVLNSGKLGERKNMNLPGNKVDIPTVGRKDAEDLRNFAADIDFVALSFVQNGEDFRACHKALGDAGKKVKIIAKIENQEGLRNFEGILDAFDGIMVARGDMGMEIPLEKVFLAQKMLIRRCNLKGKPVVTATQMLESMTSNPRPTRAESTDVANAVLDGTDCVMLSGETASGAYPIEAVNMIANICREAEGVINHAKLFQALGNSVKAESFSPPADDSDSGSSTGSRTKFKLPNLEAIASGVVKAQIDSDAKLIVIVSGTEHAVQLVAKYRPGSVVVFVTTDASLARMFNGIHSAVYSVVVGDDLTEDKKLDAGISFGLNRKWVEKGDSVAVLRKVDNGRRGGFKYLVEVDYV